MGKSAKYTWNPEAQPASWDGRRQPSLALQQCWTHSGRGAGPGTHGSVRTGVGGECSRRSGQRPTRPAHTRRLLGVCSVGLSGSACPTGAGYGTSRSQPRRTPSSRGSGERTGRRPASPRLLDEDGCSPSPLPYHHQLCRRPRTLVSLSSRLPKVGWFQTHTSALPRIHKT